MKLLSGSTEEEEMTMTKYPYYSVEGRRFESEHFQFAVHFASNMANQMGRQVHLIRVLDPMTPDSVIYTAEPEQNYNP